MKKHRLITAIAVAGLLCAGAAFAEDAPLPVQIVDAMNKIFGVHPGFRANHAKGVVVEGTFVATPEAAALSKAVIFNGSAYPVTVRFSDATGVPTIPDGAPNANGHGMAIKFHLPGSGETDMVMNALKFFPVSTGEEFRDLLLAIAASPKDAPKPTKLDQFIAAHPTVPAALSTVKTPDSYAHEEFYSINAFVLVNKEGKKQAVRYIVAPEQVVHLTAEEAAKRDPNFLTKDLQDRLAKGPVTFHLKAQLAAEGDQTKDPSKPWPDDRKVVDLGVFTINKLVPNSDEAQKALLFLPGRLVDGIEASDDPLIELRDQAYAVSFTRRSS